MAAIFSDSPEPGAGSMTLRSVPVDRLSANRLQPRNTIEPHSVVDLVASIKSHGILQPLLVRRDPERADHFEIVAGERRWRAAVIAELETVPCVIQASTDDHAATAALVENLQRLDLNGIEEAQGYRRLVEQFGLTQDAIADIVGKSRSHVANTLRLLKLPQPTRDLLTDGKLSAGHARALLGHPDPAGAAQHVVSYGLSVRQTEALAARAAMQQAGGKTSREPDVDIEELERGLADALGVSVRLRSHDGRGSLTFNFSTLGQLDMILQRLGTFRSSRP